MSLINLFKSLLQGFVTGSRTIPSILAITVGLIDTSGNSILQDTVLPDIKSGESVDK